MTFEPSTILAVAAAYLGFFYAIAWMADKGKLPAGLLEHPLVYTLALGIIISTWSFTGAFTSAATRGFGYNAMYLGYGGAFLFAPLLLLPYLRITRTWKLSSLADVFAFRFRSPWAGTLTTLVLLLCAIPLLAVQTLAVTQSTTLLAPSLDSNLSAFLYCTAILLLTLRFGTRDVSGRERSNSLLAGLAFESVIKILALLVAGVFALYHVFGGPENLQSWLESQPGAVTRLDLSFLDNSTNLLILLFFTSAVAMPHVFHMLFVENRNPRHLHMASWGIPLCLLLASLPILPLLWSYEFLEVEGEPQFAALLSGLASQAPGVTLFYYIGIIAAANGMVIVLITSLSSMCMNHLLLRIKQLPTDKKMYSWLLLNRQLVSIGIVVIGFLSYQLIAGGRYLNDARNISFIASVQFLPGILVLLYWPRANRCGFLSGLAGGLSIWLLMGLVPLLTGSALTSYNLTSAGQINWNLIAILSIIINLFLLIFVSLMTRTGRDEQTAAEMCNMLREGLPIQKRQLVARTPEEFIQSLSVPLGADTARQETLRALDDLNLDIHEKRPFFLQQLRMQIGNNLSALLGPTIGYSTVERFLPFGSSPAGVGSTDIKLMESRLESWPGSLSGIAIDLDLLRRHHRQVLQDLPLGVCSVDQDGLISLWNRAMADITGIDPLNLIGLSLQQLPAPWNVLLEDFLHDESSSYRFRHEVVTNGKQRWLNMHKASLDQGNNLGSGTIHTRVIMVEDQTETSLLEQELAHAERLSSIGRLAAGVAHEIGNPVTGIACLAQNLREECNDSQHRDMSNQILEQTRRISDIVQSLVKYSHSGMQADQPARKEKVDLQKAADEAILLLSLQQDKFNIPILNHCKSQTFVLADKQQILQIFLNLLSNARDASKDGDTVEIHSLGNDTQVTLIINDRGCGIPEQVKARIFEPFFTTKEPGKGTGLGLSLVYQIVTGLGGSVQISNTSATSSDTGTQVIVTFPCYDRPS